MSVVRLLFCSVQLMLAVVLSMPGCTNTKAPHCPEPVDDPSGVPIGALAPEITGEDIDGAFFKLSDYRGKVVLLDFWGNW
jgi:hypothetical protein